MKHCRLVFILLLSCWFGCAFEVRAQTFAREFTVAPRLRVTIENPAGQVRVVAIETRAPNEDQPANQPPESNDKAFLEAASPDGAISENDILIKAAADSISIQIQQTNKKIDLTVRVPERSRLKITGASGAIEILGDFESAEAATDTGTIYADVPTENLKYNFLWTERRPLFFSETALADAREKSAGKFSISGKLPDEKNSKSKIQSPKLESQAAETALANEPKPENGDEKLSNESKKDRRKIRRQRLKDQQVALDLTTRRGLILFNVPPSQVPSDLRERPLTAAAKAIVESGDSLLAEAIRKVSPQRFEEFARSLPPRRAQPNLAIRTNNNAADAETETLRRASVSVTDSSGRAISDLAANDFAVFENGEAREITDVGTTDQPFNLVLLLDVSGSVEERADFIRKAARNFINTVSPRDKLAVVTFRDDVQILSNFSQDKQSLSAALDAFDAGGATALYDALGFVLAETLRPLRRERTAIVILSDGDDNRSFLPLEPLLGAIEESGTLVYPLYVPSSLATNAAQNISNQKVDPLRARITTVTSKAESDARKLAEASGGVYFPIRRLEDLQKAYEDVAKQLRTAYGITFRSNAGRTPRLRVTVKQPGAFVRVNSITELRETGVLPKPQSSEQFGFRKIAFGQTAKSDSDITGEIKSIAYKQFANSALKKFAFENFDVNRAPPAFLIGDGNQTVAVSRWVSPKRTRSYPYERVYNTLPHKKRAAVIPVVKDEGKNGERDFLAWDTVSLLNLLEVHAVLAYYDRAQKSARRADSIVEQEFNNEFVTAKLKEIARTDLSAFEWNLRELKNLGQTVERARLAYQKISREIGVEMHDEKGLTNFGQKINRDAAGFLNFSREKSQSAQTREFLTEQPKETLPSRTKSRITISDYLGGKYFFTVDEAVFAGDTLFLIESKHNQGGKLTNPSDIKDGLVKMILYRNLLDVRVKNKAVKFKPVLRLTASLMRGAATSDASDADFKKFLESNNFDRAQTDLLRLLIEEARRNDFLIRLEQAETAKRF